MLACAIASQTYCKCHCGGKGSRTMSAESIRRIGSLTSSNERDPEEPAVRSAGTPALTELLGEWRAAERGLAKLQLGSDEWARLQVEIDGLRQRYQEAFDAMTNADPTRSAT